MIRKPSKQDGFTLIELLVVVVIIGILASVAVPNFMGAQDKAKNSGVQSNGHSVQMALEQYAVDNASVYPSTLMAATNPVIGASSTYLTAFPRTPWNTQQAANISIPNAAPTAEGAAIAVNTSLGAGTSPAAPTAITNYGAVSYRVPSTATAAERYELMGSGKSGNNAVTTFYVRNF